MGTISSIRRRCTVPDIGYANNSAVPFQRENNAPRANAASIRPGVWPFEWNNVSGQGLLLHVEQSPGYPLPVPHRQPRESALSPIA